jgi:hypothetical protein
VEDERDLEARQFTIKKGSDDDEEEDDDEDLSEGSNERKSKRKYQVKIQLNPRHKRLFNLNERYTKKDAQRLLEELERACNFWSLSESLYVPKERYEICTDEAGVPVLLGQGSFGKVFRAKDTMQG